MLFPPFLRYSNHKHSKKTQSRCSHRPLLRNGPLPPWRQRVRVPRHLAHPPPPTAQHPLPVQPRLLRLLRRGPPNPPGRGLHPGRHALPPQRSPGAPRTAIGKGPPKSPHDSRLDPRTNPLPPAGRTHRPAPIIIILRRRRSDRPFSIPSRAPIRPATFQTDPGILRRRRTLVPRPSSRPAAPAAAAATHHAEEALAVSRCRSRPGLHIPVGSTGGAAVLASHSAQAAVQPGRFGARVCGALDNDVEGEPERLAVAAGRVQLDSGPAGFRLRFRFRFGSFGRRRRPGSTRTRGRAAGEEREVRQGVDEC